MSKLGHGRTNVGYLCCHCFLLGLNAMGLIGAESNPFALVGLLFNGAIILLRTVAFWSAGECASAQEQGPDV